MTSRIAAWQPENFSCDRHITYVLSYLLTLLTDLLTYLITPCSSVLLEKLTGSQLVKKFPAFYGNRRIITAFTSARHLSLSWARSIQSMPPPPSHLLQIHLTIILPSRTGSSTWSLSLDFPTKTLYASHLSPIRATCPANLILLDLINRKIFGEKYRCDRYICAI